MSFDNHYPNRKDKRGKYYKSKRFDSTCRPRGSCPYCQAGRKHKQRVAADAAREAVKAGLDK